MGHWQSKFLFSVVLYGAGFLTAVYFLAPKPVSAADQSQTAETSSWLQPAQAVSGNIDSEVWIMKVRAGIDTSIHFAEEHALKVANLIRSQMAQGSKPSSQTVVE
ncbi:MAG: hypothetical protein J7K65_03575 [Planctomycetes bacterium]|nr:hypothetical protein [Planctomycetota bacterium]